MKIIEDKEHIIGSCQSERKKFEIMQSPKAFKILSSSLYKNKIRAVVRELITNMVDAHILNNNRTDSFEIHAPSRLDPRFIVRDYGPGLNDDDMQNIYTVYFASTKNNSNDFIGALGLGSKSPFSYTNSFTVVSYHDGMVRGYNAIMDNGEPSLQPTFTSPMNPSDKTGIEITVPVKIDDIIQFRSEIKYILRPFKDWNPKTNMRAEIGYFPSEKESSEYFCYDDFYGNHYNNRGLYAIYGNIVYPITNIDGVQCILEYDHRRVYIRFPMGELDVTPSREELSYDNRTIENIKSRIETINSRLIKEEVSALNEMSTRALWRKLNSYSTGKFNIITGTKNGGFSVPYGDINKLNKALMPDDSLANHGVIYDIAKNARLKKFYKGPDTYRPGLISIHDIYGPNQPEINILVCSAQSKRLKIIRGMASSGMSGRIVVFKSDVPDEMETMKKVVELFDGDKINIFKTDECEKFIKIDIKNHEKNQNQRPASNNIHIYTNGTSGWDVKSYKMTVSELDKLEGYAIIKSRNDIKDFDTDSRINISAYDIRQMADVCGINKFIIIRPSALKRCRNNSNIKSLFRLAKDKYKDLIKSTNEIGNLNALNHISNDYNINRFAQVVMITDLHKHIMKDFNISENAQQLSYMNEYMIYMSKTDKDLHKCVVEYNERIDDFNSKCLVSITSFMKKYPALFTLISRHVNRGDKDIINNIIDILNKIEEK